MDFLSAVGLSAGAIVLIPIVIMGIKVIYLMCLFARIGDIKNNQYELKNQINEQKRTNELLMRILKELIESKEKENEIRRNPAKILEEMKLENEKLKNTINKNTLLINEIEQKIEKNES